MGEGILIYGLNNDRRKYARDLQTFADKVLKIGRPKGLLYKFGNISRTVARYMREQIENNKIKQQQNGKTKEIRLRFR